MKIDGNNDGFEGSPLKVCENCKWWAPPGGGWFETTFGSCLLAESNNSNPVAETTLAFAVDKEMYSAGLATSPKFGCIQWERKE